MKSEYKSVRKIVSKAKVSSVETSETTETKTVDVPVDFDELHRANKDIYAWINIPDTVIDYPILRKNDDDSYYLTHTVNGKKSKYGSIYTESYNSMTFGDFNTLIYGHNMRDGTMFGSLKKYKDQNYLKAHKFINIYMPGRVLKYEIFAAYVWNDRHILFSYDFNDDTVRKDYLNTISSLKGVGVFVDGNISVDENDKIITLSTCTSKDNERFLVQGVLIDDSEEQ